MKKLPFTEKSVEELVKEANASMAEKTNTEDSEEKLVETDADYGYFQEQ